ncbi:16S rRNA (cytosine(1402)-N(4))-methyltransferase RsmH [Micrococcales bacterium 31B]|nr:16S rRNA (cytosine(1402)-N(4))-methyltransferase RsmH [Micrococcales bacterium 31B]
MSEKKPAEQRHVPVMLQRCVDLMKPSLQHEGAIAVDATLGMGGHSQRILQDAPSARLIGIDRDTQALDLARDRLERAGVADRATLVHSVYDEIPEVLADLGLPGADAILMDLGVSSLQLDEADRGFAYAIDAPLDMRMNKTGDDLTAADILNTYSAQEISRILFTYGEEKFARKIAAAVVREREQAPFDTSGRLVDLLRRTVPQASQRTGGHPAKRTFQALRIEVNQELSVLEAAIPAACDALRPDGRLVVMSYHSLEDRIVKQEFVRRTASKAPLGLPVELPEHRAGFETIVRGSEKASPAELEENPRSASVRLRGLRRLSTQEVARGQ